MSAFLDLIKQFKIYDATVGKTSLKTANSSLSIFFVIISVCVIFESYQGYSGTEFKRCGVKARKENSNSRLCVHVVFITEKWSFHVANFWRTGKKCTEIVEASEGRAKVLLVFIKYAKFAALSLPSRRRS